MIHVNEQRLESDLSYRFRTVRVHRIWRGRRGCHSCRCVRPRPGRADAGECGLRSTSPLRRHLETLPASANGLRGAVPKTLEELTQDHEMIRYRKEHLARYLTALVTQTLRRQDGRLPRYGRQDAHVEGRGQRTRRAPGADECPARLCGRCLDQHDLEPGPGAWAGSANAAGLQQAALAAKRPHQPPLPGKPGAGLRGLHVA